MRARKLSHRQRERDALHKPALIIAFIVLKAGLNGVFPVGLSFALFLLIKEIGIPVRVDVEHHAAVAQNAPPLAVGLHWIGQVPGQISRDDNVKLIVGEIELLRVHLEKAYPFGKLAGVAPCLLEHTVGNVYGRHVIAACGEDDRVKARTCADVQHSERSALRLREIPYELVSPFSVPAVGEVFFDNLGVRACAARPVLLYRVRECVHGNSP